MPTVRRQFLERELKFRVDPGFKLPHLTGAKILARTFPVVADGAVSLEKIARSQFKKLRWAMHKGGAKPSDTALHRIRIQGKRCRHAADLARLIERQGERRRDARKKWPKIWARVKKCGQAVWN